MADTTAFKKRGRKPAPAMVIAQPAVTPPAIPAMDTASPEVIAAMPVAAPVPVAPPEPVAEPEPFASVPEQVAEAAVMTATPVSVPEFTTTPASADAEPLTEGSAPMATTYDATATTAEATDKAKALFGDLNERAKSAMEKSVKLGEEVTEFTKGNVEALVTSGRVAAKGAETIAQDVAESMKKHFESTTATWKSFASVKSPTELFQLQSDYAKTYFDGAVAEASKFSESLMKLAGDIAQPLSSRYAVAAEKIKASTAL